MDHDRLNVLLILDDQHRFDCLGSMGHPVVRTPNLDALARRGVLFTSAYTPSTPCAPARGCIFTGRYCDTHGLGGGKPRQSRGDHFCPQDYPVFTERLGPEAGYQTALVGKLHLKPIARHYGFEHCQRSDSCYGVYDPEEPRDSAYVRWLREQLGAAATDAALAAMEADELTYKNDDGWTRFLLGTNVLDEEHHNTAWTANETLRFLRDGWDRSRPFFLNSSFFGPHQPYLCPGRWATMYDPDEIPLPDDFHVEIDDKPILRNCRFLADKREERRRLGWTPRDYKRLLAAYYGGISMIDHYLGRVFDELERQGLWDSTIVAFASDHGDYMGQFELFTKSLGYESSAHVPLIVADPRTPDAGRRERRNVSTIDLHPTFLSAAGLDCPPDAEGRDLTGLLSGSGDPWDNHAYFKARDCSMLVRDRWKLMRAGRGEAKYELYDLDSGPLDSVNRFNDPACGDVQKRMRAELDNWHDNQERMAR